jgi:hypothetical protein
MIALGDGLEMSRPRFLDLLAGVDQPDDGRWELARADIATAGAMVTVTTPGLDGDGTTLWIGVSHTTIVRGMDPVSMWRIRSANTPLALIDLLGLARDTGSRPTELPDLRWWRLDLHDGRPDDESDATTWELIDGSPGGSWFVIDDRDRTRVEPTSLAAILQRICDTVRPVLAPF